jgi:elongator complex protein 2
LPVGISALLSGHKETVKAVKFLPDQAGAESWHIISGSDDQTLKIWSVSKDFSTISCIQTAHEHTAAIHCVATLKSKSNSTSTVVASGGADATIRIWKFESRQLQLLQVVKLAPKYFPLSLALSSLNATDDVYVLASAGTKDIIQVFAADAHGPQGEFTLQATLSGHEGWIRSLDFTWERDEENSDLLLASASQDKYIRLWRVHQGKELPALARLESDARSSSFLPGKSPSNKAHRLQSAGIDFSITFEALLLGHEDWIYSAKWSSLQDGKLRLLSTSADNSLAMWEADPTSGIWVSMIRLGEISRDKGATTATGSIGGFWTGLWSHDGKSVICLGRTGSWRRWDYDFQEDQWKPSIAVSGHTRSVTGISWSQGGRYLMSTSLDQTSRLHAQWQGAGGDTWHEMSRPQIHGYDLNCIDTLGPSQFVSGADEKLLRVFSQPKAVSRLLSRLSGITQDVAEEYMPDAANIPVLGLSNKAIDAIDDDQELQQPDHNDRDALDPASMVRKSILEIDRPPFEDSLSRHTLWPEIEKLYGHGYEISCIAASHDGKLIASACKASSINHAVIRLFETERWTEVRPPLTAHSLTATRLRFSGDDKYLLSVGRDRQWAVFERDEEEQQSYRPLQANPKGHSRMILDASWALLDSPRVFATAGRDKQVKIWGSKPRDSAGIEFEMVSSIAQEHPVTAVDYLGRLSKSGNIVLAVGTEAGKLTIYSMNPKDHAISSTLSVEQRYAC